MKKAISGLVSIALIALLFISCGTSSSTVPQESSTQEAATDESTAEVTDIKESEAKEPDGYATEIDREEEPYTVAIQVVTLPGSQFEGKANREEQINAITVPAINCKVEIQEVWISEVASTTSMAVAGDEKVDLLHVATVNPLSSLVGSDILLDMQEENLLQNRGQALVELFGDLLDAGFVNNQQLAIPAKLFNATSKGIMYNGKLAEEAGVSFPKTATLDEFEELLYDFKQANGEVMPYFIGDGELNFLYWLQGYETFGNESSYGIIQNPNSGLTVENLYATEMFKDFALRMYRWRTDGIHPGDPTDTNPAQTYFNAEQLLTNVIDISPAYQAQYNAEASFPIGYTQLVGPSVANSSITEYMWGIASNSQRPDKAMDLLNFIYTNAEVANILKYGLEGENYAFAEGSDRVIESNNSYSPLFYFAGNSQDMFIKAPATEELLEEEVAFEASAEISPVSFYMFDDSNYQTEASVIYSTIMEYLPRIQNGMADSEQATLDLLEEFNEKLTASGIEDVIVANQAQLDAWLTKQ